MHNIIDITKYTTEGNWIWSFEDNSCFLECVIKENDLSKMLSKENIPDDILNRIIHTGKHISNKYILLEPTLDRLKEQNEEVYKKLTTLDLETEIFMMDHIDDYDNEYELVDFANKMLPISIHLSNQIYLWLMMNNDKLNEIFNKR